MSKAIATRHTTRDESRRRSQTAPTRSRSRSADIGLGISRVLIPLFFIIAGGTIVYMLCYHFLPGGPGETLRRISKPPPGSPPKVQPIYPEKPAAAKNIPAAESPTISSGAVPDAPPISADGATAIRAEQVLDEFLATSLLDERLGLIDPPLSVAELEGTILDMPLPEVINVSPETPSFDPVENLGDFPFRVSFQGGEGSIVEYTVLVRQRADLEPKVVVGPFLDLVGGRLERFASTPTEGAQTFNVIMEAMPRCFEENIPNPSKKFTYKLSGSNVGRAIARAYASLNSSLAEQLWTPDSRIRWGKRIRATVTLQWNTREDPSQPYIELMEIKGLDWNS
ncbi:hypothetical protein [Haloferula sp.]|uniref:hypothetical protein n=1 Tax=Haloferula sp. TaxID=2497595 RepID=UPI003C74E326